MPGAAAGASPSLGSLPEVSSVLAVCAHPDDESFGLGGLLDAYSRAGVATAVLCFTHGEGTTLGALQPEEARAVRAGELAAAARELGVGTVVLRDHPDGGLDAVPLEVLVEDVSTVASSVGADMLLAFDEGGVTGHPDHEQATRAAVAAGARTGLPVLGWALSDEVARSLDRELGVRFVGRGPEEVDAEVRVDRARQWRAIDRHASQSTDNPVVHLRLSLQGDREVVRWLRAGPDAGGTTDRPPRPTVPPVGAD